MRKIRNLRKETLINEIIKLCLDYGVLINIDMTKIKIEDNLDEIAFIESVIGVIRKKAKNWGFIELSRVKELVIELEIIRIELEFKCYKPVSSNRTDNLKLKKQKSVS